MVTVVQQKPGLGAWFGSGMEKGMERQQELQKAVLVQNMKGEEKRRSVLAQMMLANGDTQGAMNLMTQPMGMGQQQRGFFGGLVDRLFGGGDRGQQQMQPQTQQAPSAPTAPREPAAAPSDPYALADHPPHTEQEIRAMGALNPQAQSDMRKANEDWWTRKKYEKDKQTTEDLELHKESLEYEKKLVTDAASGTRSLSALNDMKKQVMTGDIGPWTLYSTFTKLFPDSKELADAFKNKHEAALSALLPELLAGRKEIFGVKLTDSDLAVLLDKVPSLGRSKEANLSVIDILSKYAKRGQEKLDIGRKVRGKSHLRPWNYMEEVERISTEKWGKEDVGEPKVATPQIIAQFHKEAGYDEKLTKQRLTDAGYKY